MTVDSAADTRTGARGRPRLSSSGFGLSADAEVAIRQVAQDVLNSSFARLTGEGILPRSRYRPWLRMARDYFGPVVEGSEGPLAQALAAALPERFECQQGIRIDYPWMYASALLEAAVAAATLAAEPYQVTSPSVQATIDELIAKVRAIPRATVLQLLADVDVIHPPIIEGRKNDSLGESIEIAGVRVIRVENQAEAFIERELPSAGYEVERSQVVVHPGPASLFAATIKLMADYESRANQARRQVNDLIAAIRLATGTTAHAVIDIQGEPERVRWLPPTITPLPSWGFRFVHRPVTLSKTDIPGLTHLASLIGTWEKDTDWIAARIALGRLSRSLDGLTPGIADQVVDLAIGLEAALAGTDKSEISLRLRTRAAGILATDLDPPDMIYRDVKTLYDLRSTFVHGGSRRPKDMEKEIKKVSGVEAMTWPAEQYLLALDRWRDLLRRAILARIALTTAAVRWTAGSHSRSQFDVDEFLLREKDQDAWRDHIRAYWADAGLPYAPERSPAAHLTIRGASATATNVDTST